MTYWRGSHWSVTPIAPERLKVLKQLKLAFNNDGGDMFDCNPEDDGPKRFQAIIDQYAAVDSAFLSWGLGRDTARGYQSRILEQEGLNVPDEELSEMDRRFRGYMTKYIAQGTDPLTILTEAAHRRGMKLLANFRINRYSKHPRYDKLIGSWFHQHPELILPENVHEGEYKLDWSKPEVREHHLAVYRDLFERYDVDGIDLEFSRAIPFFKKDEPNKTQHMNEFLKGLRREADRIGDKRKKKLSIAIQYMTPEYCSLARPFLDPEPLNHGLDPAVWAKEGYVDILIPGIWGAYNSAPADITPYLELVKGTHCKLYAFVAWGILSHEREVNLLTIRQLSEKCDGVYIFNANPTLLAALVEDSEL